jgi:hypothetical protein
MKAVDSLEAFNTTVAGNDEGLNRIGMSPLNYDCYGSREP